MIAALRALAAVGTVGPVSSLWETDPVGGPGDQPTYRNAVATWRPAGAWASPQRALAALLAIELALGRERRDRWGPRRIDIDLLAWDAAGAAGGADRPARSGLPRPDLPHPRAFERPFVLVPWSEVAPGWRDPRSGATVADAAAAAGRGGVRPAALTEAARWATSVAALAGGTSGAVGAGSDPR
jgi:2-amino-4-hydroxy-6-hydroxymethyldihydropteridine diphosphokinase